MTVKTLCLLSSILLTGLPSVVVRAADAPGGISISPVRIDLAAQQHAAAITVSNAGNVEKLIQVEPMQWSHPQGTDQYEVSRDLVVNPPLFRLPPGGSQVVRIGLARQARPDDKVEKAFRVFFQELPHGPDAMDSQLKILLRIGVPVFVKPVQIASSDLRWLLKKDEGNQLTLKVRNAGNLHERVSSLTLNVQPGETLMAEVPGFAYVLPGQVREWQIMPRVTASAVQLHATTEGGTVHAELPLSAQ